MLRLLRFRAIRRGGERGALSIEFVALTVLAGLMVAAVVAAPAVRTLGTYTTTAVNKILDTDDHVDTESGPGIGNFSTAGAPTAQAALAMRYALAQLGKPYLWGGTGPNAFDCSGLMYWAYGKAGVHIQRVADDQYFSEPKVAKSDLKPGDLVFFHTEATRSGGPSHVGMYIGGGQFVQAPHTGDVVKVSKLSDSYYVQTYAGATRPTG
ncbi:MAG TPA: C40 family peptidase [Streptosporangiaceae bacterium]